MCLGSFVVVIPGRLGRKRGRPPKRPQPQVAVDDIEDSASADTEETDWASDTDGEYVPHKRARKAAAAAGRHTDTAASGAAGQLSSSPSSEPAIPASFIASFEAPPVATRKRKRNEAAQAAAPRVVATVSEKRQTKRARRG